MERAVEAEGEGYEAQGTIAVDADLAFKVRLFSVPAAHSAWTLGRGASRRPQQAQLKKHGTRERNNQILHIQGLGPEQA